MPMRCPKTESVVQDACFGVDVRRHPDSGQGKSGLAVNEYHRVDRVHSFHNAPHVQDKSVRLLVWCTFIYSLSSAGTTIVTTHPNFDSRTPEGNFTGPRDH